MDSALIRRLFLVRGGAVLGVAASLLAHAVLAALLWRWSLVSGPPPTSVRRTIEVRLLTVPAPQEAAREPPIRRPGPPRQSPVGNPARSPARAAGTEPLSPPVFPELPPLPSTPAAPSTVEDATEAPLPPGSEVSPGETLAPSEDSALEEEYRQRLWLAISAAKPPGIRLTGEAVVSFSLDASGQIRSLEIARSSGNVLLDKLALSCVRRAAPLPPPPPALSARTPRFSIAVQFH